MRFAHSQGSDPASDTSGSWKSLPTPGQVRVLLFLSQKRQTATATCDPRGDLKIMSAHKKTPLMQPTSGTVSYVTLQTSAPASTLSLPPTVDPPARCNRGQVQSTSPIHVTNSNPEANLSRVGCH